MRNQCLKLLILCRKMPSRPIVFQLKQSHSLLLRPPATLVDRRAFSSLRYFSSSTERIVEPHKDSSDQSALLPKIFYEAGLSDDEIKERIDLKNVLITHDLILKFLQGSETKPDVSKRVFDWVSRNHSEKLSSKSYNWMLGILGSNGLVKDVWDMIMVMKQRGYGVSKGAYDRIFEKFQIDGLDVDIEKLQNLYASGSVSCKNSDADSNASRITKLIRKEIWGDHVEKQLSELNVVFSSDLVAKVLDAPELDPNKALIFFRWVQETGTFIPDQRSYNAIARVLSKEDHSPKFWRLVGEMRSEGHELEKETYIIILQQFVKRKMIKDAVNLYEFATLGKEKPSNGDCTFLLKKIVVSNELDIELLQKVIRCFKANGNALSDAQLSAVIKSLISTGRLMTEWLPILSALEEAGYSGNYAHHKLAFNVSFHDKVGELLLEINKGSYNPQDHGTWKSLIEGYCTCRNIVAATNCFRLMIDKEGSLGCERCLNMLIRRYCKENHPFTGYKFLVEMVNGKGLKPWCITYNILTQKLLDESHFKEALNVMSLMKAHDYPPYLDCFMNYLSKKGSSEDSIEFTKALASKKFPGTSLLVELFGRYFAVGRRSEAQDLLGKCPSYIKNNAEILNLFNSSRSQVAV